MNGEKTLTYSNTIDKLESENENNNLIKENNSGLQNKMEMNKVNNNQNGKSELKVHSDSGVLDDSVRNCEVMVKVEAEEMAEDGSKTSVGHSRENRLTNIIEQLRYANKLKGNTQRLDNILTNSNNGEGGGGGGGGGVRRCVRDAPAPSPAHAPPTASRTTVPQPHSQPVQVKCERLSPHDNQSTASRSRSVTPSTSSYPGTPPERGSPHAPAATASLPATAPAATTVPATTPRNYSDIMRSLAARYNTPHNNYYFHRMNGFGGSTGMEARVGGALPSPARGDVADAPLGGLFTGLAKKQGGPPRLPAFPDILDMSSTRTLLTMSRVGRGGRDSRRKRYGSGSTAGAAGEHSPLDLSAASESAAKRARLSTSPSTRSDSDDREGSNDDRTEGRGECMCAEARARLFTWSVDDVCEFINSIDICAEYVMNFREQRIDGAGLPLLTEDHLTGMLQMKLGPALKLRAVLANRLEPCSNCQNGTNLGTCGKLNGNIVKPEPRSNTTSPS